MIPSPHADTYRCAPSGATHRPLAAGTAPGAVSATGSPPSAAKRTTCPRSLADTAAPPSGSTHTSLNPGRSSAREVHDHTSPPVARSNTWIAERPAVPAAKPGSSAGTVLTAHSRSRAASTARPRPARKPYSSVAMKSAVTPARSTRTIMCRATLPT